MSHIMQVRLSTSGTDNDRQRALSLSGHVSRHFHRDHQGLELMCSRSFESGIGERSSSAG